MEACENKGQNFRGDIGGLLLGGFRHNYSDRLGRGFDLEARACRAVFH